MQILQSAHGTVARTTKLSQPSQQQQKKYSRQIDFQPIRSTPNRRCPAAAGAQQKPQRTQHSNPNPSPLPIPQPQVPKANLHLRIRRDPAAGIQSEQAAVARLPVRQRWRQDDRADAAWLDGWHRAVPKDCQIEAGHPGKLRGWVLGGSVRVVGSGALGLVGSKVRFGRCCVWEVSVSVDWRKTGREGGQLV